MMPTEYNFVACPSYHGATLMAMLLNNHSQLVSLGDTIPRRLDASPCVCGATLETCPFWQRMQTDMGLQQQDENETLFAPLPEIMRTTRKNMMANYALARLAGIAGPAAWNLQASSRDAFLDRYSRLHQVTCEITEARKFIDGTKNPVKIYAFENMLRPRPVIRVLHITRDPRAFIASCRKYNELPLEVNTRYWRRYHRFALKHFANNPRMEYLQLRLEDLCTDADAHLEKVQQFFGVEPEQLTVPSRFESKRHLVGNRSAINRFDGHLKLDESFREKLSATEQSDILKRTNPLAARFGYAG
jgi:hypothetical protein